MTSPPSQRFSSCVSWHPRQEGATGSGLWASCLCVNQISSTLCLFYIGSLLPIDYTSIKFFFFKDKKIFFFFASIALGTTAYCRPHLVKAQHCETVFGTTIREA